MRVATSPLAAGSMLLNTAGSGPSPYQPIPRPSPLVVVAPPGVEALVDDRVLRFKEQLFGEDRSPE
jgi:hypothetical protein